MPSRADAGWTARPRPSALAASASSRPTQAGFALIYALLAIILLTALATAGFLLSTTDYRIAGNHRASVGTFYSTEGGRSHFLAEQGVPDPTVDYVYDRDAVTVSSRQLIHLSSGETVYQVTSDGLDQNPVEGGARRRTQNLAVFVPYTFRVPGAFTAVNGLVKNGVAGTIDGNDQAPPGPCPYSPGSGGQPAVAGVAVPPGGYQQNGGNQPMPDGNPPVDDSQSAGELLDFTEIDWEGLVNETKVVPDVRTPAYPWPDFPSLPADEWPVIHVTSDDFTLEPEHSGRGAIFLDGDVALDGDFSWEGVILVGGRLVSNGNQTISGAIITGLNRLLPGPPPAQSELANGTKSFLYDSCDVEAALRAMGWLAEKPGTWRERI